MEALVRRSCLPCTPGLESLVQLAANSAVSNYTLLAPHFGILPVELQSMLRHEAAFSPGTAVAHCALLVCAVVRAVAVVVVWFFFLILIS